MTFVNHFTCINKIYTIQKTDTYQVLVSLDVKTFVPETLMQKNNTGIIDDDMRIK